MLPCGSIKLEMPLASTPYAGPTHNHDILDENIVYINKPDQRVADIILENWDLKDRELVGKTLFVGRWSLYSGDDDDEMFGHCS